MTILEKIKFEEEWLSEVNLTKENIKIAFAGIRATVLEQQPCEDCVSRKDAIKEFQVYREYDSNRTNDDWVDRIELVLTDLPSVTPIISQKETVEDCISRADVLALAEKGTLVSNGNYKSVCKAIKALPSVMPKALEQTGGDCISREAVLDIINFEDEWLFDAKSHNADTKIAFSTIKSKISELPSVTPKAEGEGKG